MQMLVATSALVLLTVILNMVLNLQSDLKVNSYDEKRERKFDLIKLLLGLVMVLIGIQMLSIIVAS